MRYFIIIFIILSVNQSLFSQTTETDSSYTKDYSTDTLSISSDPFDDFNNSLSDTNTVTPSISIINLDEFNSTPDSSESDNELKNSYIDIIPDTNKIDITEPEIIIEEKVEIETASEETPTYNYSDYSVLSETPEEDYSIYKPYIGYGYGVFTFKGEVSDNYKKNPLVGRIGKNLTISKSINDYFDIKFQAIHGHITGNERHEDRNLNFQTEILSGGISVGYNFKHLIKKTLPIKPFVYLGLEYFEYNSKGDLYDSNGRLYYYWSDGSLRNLPENSINSNTSIILQRDYNYETDLRDLNLDGLGKYQQLALGIPIDFGFDFPVNKYLDVRLGHSIHFTFSDLVDNVSSKGIDSRQGQKGYDRFSYTYLTFRINLFVANQSSDSDYKYNDEDFVGINGDEDIDGISDFTDMCPGTPVGIPVDANGCPIDADGDGIADYLDQEPNTSKDVYYVDNNGVGKSEADYENSLPTDTIAINADEVYAFYPSLKAGVKQFNSVFLEIPKRFKPFDLNKDSYISPDELSKAIDMFFDFGSNLTIDDIYELNEYFFTQGDDEEDW